MNSAYLLDTNVVSELRKQRPHGGVVAWLQSVDDTQLYLSAVTLGDFNALGLDVFNPFAPAQA